MTVDRVYRGSDVSNYMNIIPEQISTENYFHNYHTG